MLLATNRQTYPPATRLFSQGCALYTAMTQSQIAHSLSHCHTLYNVLSFQRLLELCHILLQALAAINQKIEEQIQAALGAAAKGESFDTVSAITTISRLSAVAQSDLAAATQKTMADATANPNGMDYNAAATGLATAFTGAELDAKVQKKAETITNDTVTATLKDVGKAPDGSTGTTTSDGGSSGSNTKFNTAGVIAGSVVGAAVLAAAIAATVVAVRRRRAAAVARVPGSTYAKQVCACEKLQLVCLVCLFSCSNLLVCV